MHRIVALALLLACLPACASKKHGIEADVELYGFAGVPTYGTAAADAPAGEPTFRVEGHTKKKADGTAFGVLRANRRLYAPFEVMLVAGLVPGEEQDGFIGNAQFCMELDERLSISEDIGTLLWVLICTRRQGTGLQVRAQDQFTELGSVLLPDTDAALLVIRHDGTDLIFETGPATLAGAAVADGGLSEIARLRDWLPATAGDALVPSMGASFLAHPATVGFERPQIVTNGDAPGGLTEEQAIAFAVGSIVDTCEQAFLHMNDGSPDPPAARAALESAQTPLEAALADVEALANGKAKKQAKSALKAAIKQVAAAIQLIDKGKPTLKVLKKIGPAARSAMRAVQALDPLPEH